MAFLRSARRTVSHARIAPRGSLRGCVIAGVVVALVAGACAAAQVVVALPVSAASSPVITIAAGTTHTCALHSGRAYCWGSNANGQLGTGSTISSSGAVAVYTGGVLSGKTLTQITAGNGFTCALDSSGAAYCWGLNTNGQLGNNSTTQSNVPVAVSTSGALAGKAIAQIDAGQNSTCALAAGAIYCWGANGSGQLGTAPAPRAWSR